MIVRVEVPDGAGPALDRLRALVADTDMTMTVEDARSREYHRAHLAFVRSAIVQAAAEGRPILDLLKAYADGVAQAERDHQRAVSS